MNKTKIAFFDIKDYEREYLLHCKPDGCEFILLGYNLQDNFDINIEKVKDVEILSIFTDSRVTPEYISKFPNLKIICTRSTGFSHIDTDYCAKNNIAVVNVPRYGDCTVAEFSYGLLLDVARKINMAYQDLQRGVINTQKYIGIDLYGKTIGIIGTGAIGSNSVRIASGFGMKILAFDPYPNQELIKTYNVEYVSLDELLANSDIINLHAPSTKENFHMINDESFKKMKKRVIVINTARGEIIDTVALYHALKDGIVGGAGLDVVECEEILGHEDVYLSKIDCVKPDCLAKTLLNHKLLELPNVVVTPHIAFDTKEAVKRILQTTVLNINSYIEGRIINRVN